MHDVHPHLLDVMDTTYYGDFMAHARTHEADIILADGSIATIRSVQADDRQRFIEFYDRVSDHSKYLRFFASHPQLTDEDLDEWINVDHHDAVTLVLLKGDDVIATARYALVPHMLPARIADVSFLVQDDLQGRGAANILLEHLAQVGRESKIERFFAEMLTSNQSMKQVFIRAGYDVRPELEDGFITVDFAIDPTERSRLVMEQRELRAEAASIRGLLTPASVAVVGVRERVEPIVNSLQDFVGEVHLAVGEDNPAALLSQLAAPVDLVISEYDEGHMQQLLAACREAKGLLLLAPGENPNLSMTAAADVIETARDHGLRVFGPASLGVINTDPDVRLNASPVSDVAAGPVGLFTQTAGIATLTLASAIQRRVGLSSFVASGAYADITANDVMQFWSDDDATRLCLVSLDAVGNPRKFVRILRRLALEKHVVIFTPSRALQSARHHQVEGLTAAPPEALDEVIRSSGAMVVSRRDTMFDIADILTRQPVPRGRRVTVISNSTGLTNQMQQAALRFGLEPSPVTVFGEPAAGVVEATREALASDTDAVLSAVVEVSTPILGQVVEDLRTLATTTENIPLAGVFVGLHPIDPPAPDSPLPVFTAYADALEALSVIASNEEQRAAARPAPDDELAESGQEAAHEIVDKFLAAHPEGGWLSDEETSAVLAAYGITLIEWQAVTTVDDAISAGERFGWDVVLKATHDMVRGRPELSTIIRQIVSPESMRRAWAAMDGLAADLGVDGVEGLLPLVQPRVPAGTTLTARAVEDPVIGPMISVGMTGVASDLLGDEAFAAPPVRRHDAAAMLARLRAAPLLRGYRGTPPADPRGLEDVLMALGRMKDDLVSLVDAEVTPIIAGPAGTSVVGARMRVVPLGAERDPLARLL